MVKQFIPTPSKVPRNLSAGMNNARQPFLQSLMPHKKVWGFISKSAKDTQNLAKKIAAQNKWQVYGLVGDLGSGKTTFAQAFLRALGVKQKITSPTFIIIKKYQFGNWKEFSCWK